MNYTETEQTLWSLRQTIKSLYQEADSVAIEDNTVFIGDIQDQWDELCEFFQSTSEVLKNNANS